MDRQPHVGHEPDSAGANVGAWGCPRLMRSTTSSKFGECPGWLGGGGGDIHDGGRVAGPRPFGRRTLTMDFSHLLQDSVWRPGCNGLRGAVQCRPSGTAMVCCQRGVGVGIAPRRSRGWLEPGSGVFRRCYGSRDRSAIASVAHRNLAQRPSRRKLHSDDSGCVRRQDYFGVVCHYGAAFDRHQ
jgi:hypothetical protein